MHGSEEIRGGEPPAVFTVSLERGGARAHRQPTFRMRYLGTVQLRAPKLLHLAAKLIQAAHGAGQGQGEERHGDHQHDHRDPQRRHDGPFRGVTFSVASARFIVRSRASAPAPIPSTT